MCMFGAISSFGQSVEVPLQDLSYFKNPAKSWKIVGDVNASLEKENVLQTSSGTGILVNLPDKKNPGKDLYTEDEYGNIDLELDYLMAKGSNSGIYFMGMYELQLMDSWGVKNPTSGDNGGIYERWDESRPQGQKGYEGYAPRQNVSSAPGLWQNLKVSFQAPRYDEQGNKIENAKFLRVVLNGVTIQEDVELSGPTRGAMSQEEKEKGPLRFQGDHGAVAFRNIKLASFDKPKPELTDLQYTIYDGTFEAEFPYDSIPPEAEGNSVLLSSNLKPRPQKFFLRFTGNLDVKEPGEYNFNLHTLGGTGLLRINNQEVIPIGGWSDRKSGKVTLPAGKLPFEMVYSKFVDWHQPALGLSLSGPGIREYLISDVDEMQQSEAVDPILVEAGDIPVLRSFMDIPDGPRVTHAVSVGSPEQIHYTYDMDHGTIVQVWRGGFIDATPMWHDRGDGSSRPRGAVEHLLKQPELTVARLSSPNQEWIKDTTGSAYRPKGYLLDKNNQPIFRYQAFGAEVNDAIRVLEGGKGVQRNISVQNPGQNLFVRLAQGNTIEELGKGMYVIDGKNYYLRLDNAGGQKASVRKTSGGQELIVPIRENLTYSILF